MQQHGKGHGRRVDSPNTKISKSLSYLLRHGAEKEGVPINADGYVLVDDVLNWKTVKNHKVSFEKLQQIVETNAKKRYELCQKQNANGVQVWYIRAVQGHTLNVDDDLLLEKIVDPTPYVQVVHGTYFQAWDLIKNSGIVVQRYNKQKKGLKTMGRNHVHFAVGMPGNEEVISGMRGTCQVFIEIDMARAMKDGIVFYLSKNKVILTSGIEGLVPCKYLKRAIDKSGKVLLECNQYIFCQYLNFQEGEQQQQQQQQQVQKE